MNNCLHLNLTPDPDCLGLSQCVDCNDWVIDISLDAEPDWGWAVTPQGEEYAVV